jgi:lantibiotic modifying enzyme
VGAANGPIGIIYMIIKAMISVPKLVDDTLLLRAVKNGVKKIVGLMKGTGVVPLFADQALYRVNFCKGSPGVIPMLYAANTLFPEDKEEYLEAAKQAGKVTWE